MKNNILVIAPHPDDEVLGCGGTIKKLSETGHNVFILIVTKGKKEVYSEEKIINVRNEAKKAHQILGIKETVFLDFPAPELDLISISEIAVAFFDVIKEYTINSVFLPHGGDIHNDHKAVYHAGLVACRPVGDLKIKNIFSYETLSETEWGSPTSDAFFIPTLFIDVSYYFSYKIEAMKCFRSQLKTFPNSRSLETIEALSKYRGSTIGVNHAEAFMTIRMIDD